MQGKNVWIVGASAGIGAALARKLAAEGAQVAVSARNEEALRQLVAEMPGGGHKALPVDAIDAASVQAAAEVLAGEWSRVDLIIYNAGAYDPMGVNSLNVTAIDKMIAVNLNGAFYLLAAAMPLFTRQGGGHLALVASVAGYRGLPNALGYGASKAGLINLAESLRVELAPKGVKVQVVNPGFVKTRLTEKNEFPMPFTISAEDAADAFFRGLQRRAFEIHFPRRFTYIMKWLKSLPNWAYFAIAAKLT